MTGRRISDALGLPRRYSLRHYQLETQDRPLWPLDWRYALFVVLHICWYGDSMQIRALMASSSIGWAVFIVTRPHILDGANYALIRMVPGWLWVTLFLVHGFGGWWRLIERRARVKTAFGINFLGVMTWLAVTMGINLSAGQAVIGSTLEWFAIALLISATINTGRNEERGTA